MVSTMLGAAPPVLAAGGTRPWLQRKCACGGPAGLIGACGDCADRKMLGLQTKLAVGAADDAYEREADSVAARVVDGPAPRVRDGAENSPGASGFSLQPAAPVPLRRLATVPRLGAGVAPPTVEAVLASPGRPLEPGLRGDMEQRFGVDFSQVRVHTDGAAARSAQAVSAHAFTAGRDVVFGAGRYAPATRAGRQLLAHELAHVVQQSERPAGPAPLQRKGFDSTVEVCHRVLESRDFEINNGGVRVVVAANGPDASVPNCRAFKFGVTLTRSEDWWPDDEIGTCEAETNGVRNFTFGKLPQGTYYLTFWRVFDHPYCCLTGDVIVTDEPLAGDGDSCRRDKDLSAMDIVHGALDLAGFIPVLGAIPDGINAGIYVIEGDWTNAGLSAVAMVPAWGDGVKLVSIGGKSVIKIPAKQAIKLGEEGLAKELKGLKAASKTEGKAAKSADDLAKEAADAKALDDTFKGGKGEGAYETTTRLKRGNLGERLATDALAADGHKVLSFKPDIRGTNQGGIDMLTMKDGVVYFLDNKALTRTGNISSVSALTTNFAKNKASALQSLKTALAAAPTKAERDVLQGAIDTIEAGNFKKVVTNANLTRGDAILSGVTDKLKKEGIEFIDVFQPLKKK